MSARPKWESGSLYADVPTTSGGLGFDEPMAEHTSFRIGGPADVFAEPADTQELVELLRWARSRVVPVFVLGAGSNLLVSDRGIRGLVVRMGSAFRETHVCGTEIRAGAATRLPVLIRRALGAGLSGLECLAGIPGTVGGAVRMNAGTRGGCIGDALVEATILDRALDVRSLQASELGMAYRASSIAESGLIVLEVRLSLTPCDPASLDEVVSSVMAKRRGSQPMGVRTAGSVFKNPPGGYAGEILDCLGAKGMQIGGARVSMKHANFIENTGTASADDVWTLVQSLKDLAFDRLGVALEPEIQRVGEWN